MPGEESPLLTHLMLITLDQIYVPSVLTFGLDDSIPFHLCLKADKDSFSHFINPSTSSSSTSKEPAITITIEREVVARLSPLVGAKTLVLGKGTVRSVPPPPTSTVDVREVSMNWEGEIRLEKDKASFGGFKTHCMHVAVGFSVCTSWITGSFIFNIGLAQGHDCSAESPQL
jgi:hypothetical protein